MPELPEVETIKNTLLPHLKNLTITNIEVLYKNTIIGDSDVFKKELTNEKIIDITRIGKFLIFHLSNEKIIISHLRMEGKFYILKKGEITKYAKVIFSLSDGNVLIYDDLRCFGLLKLSYENCYKNDELLKHIAKEPKDINIDLLFEKSKNNNECIKTFLLDQKNVAGLGNIYVDETLFKSNINPKTKAKYINYNELNRLIKNADEILNKAINLGGSTIKSYHPSKGVDGRFQNLLQIYDKKNQKCPNCQRNIRKIKVNGRGSSFCPNCQPYKNDSYNIAIYGDVGVGKSTILNLFKEYGCLTFNADEIVKTLYEDKNIINEINKIFDLNDNYIDRAKIKEKILKNPLYVNKLNRLIHPKVKQECLKIIKKTTKQNKVFEIPLLYTAKMEDIFDIIILIKSNKQKEYLQKRNPGNYQFLLSINKNNIIKEDDADFIIENNGNINKLKQNVITIINKLKDRLN